MRNQDATRQRTGLVELRASALFVATEALFTNRRDQIIVLAARYRVPTC
jgi:hypothetical protein